MTRPEVAVLGGGGWHGRHLRAALERAGASVRMVSFAACGFDPRAPAGIRLGDLADLPDLAFARFIPAGTFEQVTQRLGVLHALEAAAVPVLNDARTIERSVDKAATSFLLARAGLPTPPFWVCEGRDVAEAVVREEAAAGHRLVLKPLFGAQGKGLRLIRSPGDLPHEEAVAGVFYLQRFVGRPFDWSDCRVLVIEGEAVAAMTRRGSSWITNLHQGARAEPLAAEGPHAELAVEAARAVGAFYAGVDLIRDPEGRLQLLEVNAMPAWQGLQSVTSTDIAGCLAASLLARLRGRPVRAVA